MNTYHEVKYLHNSRGEWQWKHTLAYLQPDAKKLLKQYKLSLDKLETPKISFWYGLGLCHEFDQFNRKTGRILAEAKLDKQEMNFWLTDAGDYYDIRLNNIYKRRFDVNITLKLYKDSGKIRVVKSEVYEI